MDCHLSMPQLSGSIRKEIRSLDRSRIRRQSGLFVVEGEKCVQDTLPYYECHYLIATPQWIDGNRCTMLGGISDDNIYRASPSEIARVSRMPSAPEVMAVYRIPDYIKPACPGENGLVVALDCVQDPGNLGTILRICDWMGVTDILASRDTVDVYSPKVVQSTMGSIARVKVHYIDDLSAELSIARQRGVAVYGTFLDGESIYDRDLAQNGIIVMGNEGKGVSPKVASVVSHRLLIPSFPPDRPTAESLNVAVATAITLAEFRRRQM